MAQPSVMDYNNPRDNINLINIYPGCPDLGGQS